MSYCEQSDVEALLQLTFSDISKPTEGKVQTLIALISSELNSVMRSVSLPTDPTDQDTLATLRLYCAYGVSGLIAVSGGGNMESVESSQGAYYRDQYTEFIRSIRSDPSLLKGAGSDTGDINVGTAITDGHTPESVMADRIGDNWEE